jgi:hypothetical protein
MTTNFILKKPIIYQAVKLDETAESIREALIFSRGNEGDWIRSEINIARTNQGVLIWDSNINSSFLVRFGDYIVKEELPNGQVKIYGYSKEVFQDTFIELCNVNSEVNGDQR